MHARAEGNQLLAFEFKNDSGNSISAKRHQSYVSD
jgi:hypothetical protein